MQITVNHQIARIVRHNDVSVRKGNHLDDFLRGRIIRRLESGRTQLGVSEELGIAQSVSPGFGNDSKMMVIEGIIKQGVPASLGQSLRGGRDTSQKDSDLAASHGQKRLRSAIGGVIHKSI
ncbi:uncharacterized protein TNCV_2718141 [Trichonephila clavipes]|nr:uncharacterized protein TNCV_2718141 [Trichonephila clavipes]